MLQSNQPHTFVVITLDPPIRKGQTFYPHIVLQVRVSLLMHDMCVLFGGLLSGRLLKWISVGINVWHFGGSLRNC
jgi:hypothetical protein